MPTSGVVFAGCQRWTEKSSPAAWVAAVSRSGRSNSTPASASAPIAIPFQAATTLSFAGRVRVRSQAPVSSTPRMRSRPFLVHSGWVRRCSTSTVLE